MKKRIVYYDILNIMACFCVVWIHCHDTFFQYRESPSWFMAFVVQILAHWAVPVFFMLTGATLLQYKEKYSTAVFFKRRISRIVVPFFLWTTIFLIWKIQEGEIVYSGMRDLLTRYLSNGVLNIYWFFYPLLAIYLAMPVLTVFGEEKNKKLLRYTLAAAVLTYSVAPVLGAALSVQYSEDFNFPVTGGYVMYVLLGYYMSSSQFSAGIRKCLYICGIAGALLLSAVTYYYCVSEGAVREDILDYRVIFTLAMAAGIFEWCKNVRWEKWLKGKALKLVSTAAGASFGIYLIHIYFVEEYLLKAGRGEDLWAMEFGSVVIYFVCMGIVLLVKRIPGIRILFP